MSKENVFKDVYIVESSYTENSWYRVWSDGFIEQGGYVAITSSAVSTKTITFPVSFTNTGYTLLNGLITGATAADMAAKNLGSGSNKTLTGFTMHITTTTYAQGKSWFACGY